MFSGAAGAAQTRKFRQMIRARGLSIAPGRASIGTVGSFVFVRIEDATRMVTVWEACEVVRLARQHFVDQRLIDETAESGEMTHHMDGVVVNWRRR